MTSALKTYIQHYIELELGVRELINRKGNSLCAQCLRCCCDIIHCSEAIKSPFLTLVHAQTEQFDEKEGFLTSSGCALEKGRPSVCYEYFCDDHFYHQPDELHAEVLLIIGALLYHATQNAQGDVALEDIPTLEELEQLDFKRLEQQLEESREAMQLIRAFYQNGSLSDKAYQTIKRIQIAEEFQPE